MGSESSRGQRIHGTRRRNHPMHRVLETPTLVSLCGWNLWGMMSWVRIPKVLPKHLNSIHPKIKLTMEIERNSPIPFLDYLVSKSSDERLSHSVYRKPTSQLQRPWKMYIFASISHPNQLWTSTPFYTATGLNLIKPKYLFKTLPYIPNFESLDTQKQPNNLNRDLGVQLSRS